VAPLVARQNATFSRSYARWFDAIYRDKYDYFGDFDLMRLAFVLDIGLYYLGVACQPYRRGDIALTEPGYSTPPSTPVYWLMRTYNRRFARMARARRARNRSGLANHRQRFMFKGFSFTTAMMVPVMKMLISWAALEVKEGWRSWFNSYEPAAEKVA